MPREVRSAVILVPDEGIGQVTGGQHVDIAIAVDIVDVGGIRSVEVRVDDPSDESASSIVLVPPDFVIGETSGNDVVVSIAVEVRTKGNVRLERRGVDDLLLPSDRSRYDLEWFVGARDRIVTLARDDWLGPSVVR